MNIQQMTDLNLNQKRIMIREDFNVPMQNGKIIDDTRIQATLPTIEFALKSNAAILLLSHLGRPTEGEPTDEFSLAPIASHLSQLLNHPVTFLKDWLNHIDIKPGQIVLCENVRFNIGEKKNDKALAKKLAALCDIFVMDAFGCAHRSEASTEGVIHYAPAVCAGPLLINEITALNNVLKNPQTPVVAIVGGAKVSGKLELLRSLLPQVNQLIVGGGIANTFIAAKGCEIGKSLYEPELINEAKQLIELAEKNGGYIPIPKDVVVAKEFSAEAKAFIKPVTKVEKDEMILDIGPETSHEFSEIIKEAGTILWNGPVGVFEFEPFSAGTRALATSIAASKAYSIAGGGDTLSAIAKYDIAEGISYISTGGGAFMEYIEKRTLPTILALEQRSNLRSKSTC